MHVYDPDGIFQDLTLPNPWGIESWAHSEAQLTTSISDGGAGGEVGTPNITAIVDLDADTIEAYGEGDAFLGLNAALVSEARAFQAYDVLDANDDPELLRGTLSITYRPPTPGGVLGVRSTLPDNVNGLGVFFRSAMASAGIDELGIWVQSNEPGQPADRDYLALNTSSGVMTATANFEGIVGAELIEYAIQFTVGSTGVFAPAGTAGSYSGSGRFILNYEVSVIS